MDEVTEGQLVLHSGFDMEEVFRLMAKGYNVYEVCQKLQYDRHFLIQYVKTDPLLMERATEARRQGADALVSTYKDLLMGEIRIADDQRDRISLIRELGTHIRWEATAVHQGTYATKVIQEHIGELKHKHNVTLTPEQIRAMAEEVLATGGEDFSDPRKADPSVSSVTH